MTVNPGISEALARPAQTPFPLGEELVAMKNAASLIAQSGLVPEAFRAKPADVMVALLTARGLGLDPMVALQKGYVVKGKFDVEVSVKLGLVMARVPDFDFEIVEHTDDLCTIKGGRKGKNPVTATFTYQQAVAAGLTTSKYGDKETWKFYRRDMMLNRALGRVLKLTCAAALYNMPIRLDEPDEESPALQPTPDDRAASGAEVLEGDAPATPSAPLQQAEWKKPDPQQQYVGGVDPAAPPSTPTPVASQPVPEDWRGRVLQATAARYGRTPPGEHKNSYATWQKNNADALLMAANEYFRAAAIEVVKSWAAVPPTEYQEIALWLEKQPTPTKKGAGAEAPPIPTSGRTDPAPAPAKPKPAPVDAAMPPEMEEGEWPDADEPAAGSSAALERRAEKLAGGGVLGLLQLFDRLRVAQHGRRFFELHTKNKRPILLDGAILSACGLTNPENDAPLAQYMDELVQNQPAWLMVCREAVKVADSLKVGVAA